MFSNGRVVSINSHVLSLTGWSASDVDFDLDIRSIIPQIKPNQIATTKTSEVGEYWIQRKDGTQFQAEVKRKVNNDKENHT